MSLPSVRPLLLAVSNRHLFASDDVSALAYLVEWSGRVARAGIDLLQIRERGLDDVVLVRVVRDVLAATRGTNCRVLVNDRLDVALAAGAAGVHLPATGLPPHRARQIAPEGFLIGRSVHAAHEARAVAAAGGADYLTFGTVFESASKAPGHPISGVRMLADACASAGIPILAIGGVTLDRVPALTRAGAVGLAGIRLFATPPTGAGDRGLANAISAIRAAWSEPTGAGGWSISWERR